MTPALIVALMLLSAQTATTGAPPAGPAPVAAATPATPATASDDPPLDLDQLRQMYRDTCEAREFGAYDDMCDQLHQQVRQAEREAAQAARRHPKAAATPQPAPP